MEEEEYNDMVSSTYANILKYHIQGMPTNIILQVFIQQLMTLTGK